MQRDWALGLLAVAQIALWMGLVVHNVNQVSFRQALCPSGLFSRMNATMRFLIGGAIIFGALLGGLLGSTTGVRGKLLAGAVGQSLTFLPVFLSPLRRMRELPSFVEPSGRGPADGPLVPRVLRTGVTAARTVMRRDGSAREACAARPACRDRPGVVQSTCAISRTS